MSENLIELKSIKELLEMNFFIPNYQRGYRWTEQQVNDLLNDINEFTPKEIPNNNEKTWYCLQPIVVKKLNDNDIRLQEEEKNTWYEVIDGQQRLTTIYLIIHYFNDRWNGEDKEKFPCIKYETRKDSYDYMNSLQISNNHAESSLGCKDCMDFYHMREAYKTIHEWARLKKEKGELDKNAFQSKFIHHARVIWYESVDEDPIKVFTRLNIGKISLTNAELIKALFLNRTNFKHIEEAHLRLRQQEIASEWDRIEYTLQNEEFWLFLNAKGYTRPTRIDFIFDLICQENKLSLSEDAYKLIGTDDYKTFRYFYEYFTHGNPNIEDCWKKIKDYFQTFMEWYNDVELYHYVGYVVANNYKISKLIEQWDNSKSKYAFIKWLKEQIQKIILKNFKSQSNNKEEANKIQYTLDNVLDYQYAVDGSDKGKCKPILLFHNIQTIINQNNNSLNNAHYQLGVFYKFPFHLYKLESWDVEHINSNTTNSGEDEETRIEWLVNVYWGVDEKTQERIKKYKDLPDEEKEMLFKDIKELISSHNEWSPDEKNRIWNYTLLDSSTNRSYGNAIFSGKRRIIIGKDQGKLKPIPKITKDNTIDLSEEKPAESSFVPLCTKQVFMKYYSTALNAPNYWTMADAEGYKNDIKTCLDKLKVTEEERS